MQPDPVSEGEPVAEACIDGVLEMGVRVDEARDDGRVGEAPALAELGRRPDGGDPAVLDRDGPVGMGGPDTGSTQSAERSRGKPCFPVAPFFA